MITAICVHGPCHGRLHVLREDDTPEIIFPIAHPSMMRFDFSPTEMDTLKYPSLLQSRYRRVSPDSPRHRELYTEFNAICTISHVFYEYVPPTDFMERALLKVIGENRILDDQLRRATEELAHVTMVRPQHAALTLLRKWFEDKQRLDALGISPIKPIDRELFDYARNYFTSSQQPPPKETP